eukprot:6173215-Pleurochrysis_carterae.AAC.1
MPARTRGRPQQMRRTSSQALDGPVAERGRARSQPASARDTRVGRFAKLEERLQELRCASPAGLAS